MCYMGMCSPKRVGFFSHIGHKQGMVLVPQSGNIGYVSWKKLLFHNYQKDRHQKPNIMYRVTVPAAKVINRLSNFGQFINRVAKIADFGHKWGKSLCKWSAYPHPAFLGSIPWVQCHTVIANFFFHAIISATTYAQAKRRHDRR